MASSYGEGGNLMSYRRYGKNLVVMGIVFALFLTIFSGAMNINYPTHTNLDGNMNENLKKINFRSENFYALRATDYHTIKVTLRADGTEHNYIETTDVDMWTNGTLYESEYASNQSVYRNGDFWIVEYDLNDLKMYEDGATNTWLYYNSTENVWVYEDYIGIYVNKYTLILPPEATWISSNPEQSSKDGNTLTWDNTDHQTTKFKYQTYDEIYGINGGMNYLPFVLGLFGVMIVLLLVVLFLIKRKKNFQESNETNENYEENSMEEKEEEINL